MNVLLIRPDGIGDEILCLPVASALRRLVPDARIAFLSSAYAAPMLEHHPDVDDVLTVTGRESFTQLVALFRRGFDAAIFLKPFRRLMMAAWVARIPQRVATGYRWYSIFANRRVYEHRRDFSKHESEYNVGLLRRLGLNPGPPMKPALVLTDQERQQACARLDCLPSPRVVVHPGGFAARTWQAAHYGELVQHLVRDGFGVVLTGSEAEGARFRDDGLRAETAGRGVLDLMGAVSLRELMAVIGASRCVVSGATGPAHMAAALAVPTVSLFDPRRNNLPIRWQPLGEGFVLRPDVPTCPRCIYEACPYWDCLDRIRVEDVAARVQQVLQQAKAMTVLHV